VRVLRAQVDGRDGSGDRDVLVLDCLDGAEGLFRRHDIGVDLLAGTRDVQPSGRFPEHRLV
jgi:hypothetical protein